MFLSRLFLLFTISSIFLILNAFSNSQDAPLVLAVHPYLPSEEIQKRFQPLADYLGSQLRRSVVVRVGRDYEDHIQTVGMNKVDIAFIGPAEYVKMTSRYGTKPLLSRMEINGSPLLSGMIVTRSDSSLKKLSDLIGKRFAFTDPESTMGSLIPLYVMEKAGITLKELGHYEHLKGHYNVALGVLAGDFDAGAIKSEVYLEFVPRGLRVLADMPKVSEHAFITRSDYPADQVELLRTLFYRLNNSTNGHAVLTSIDKEATALVPVQDANYNNLREMLKALMKDVKR